MFAAGNLRRCSSLLSLFLSHPKYSSYFVTPPLTSQPENCLDIAWVVFKLLVFALDRSKKFVVMVLRYALSLFSRAKLSR